MKKLIFAFLVGILLVAFLASCTGPQNPTSGPTAIPPTVHKESPTSTLTLTPSPPTATATPITTVLNAENLSAGDPYIPELGNQGYEVENYNLHLILDPQKVWIDGDVTIAAKSTMADLRQVSFDFVGFEIKSIIVDGQSATSFRDGKKLIVNLPTVLSSGADFSVSIAYQGEPVMEQSPYVPFVPHLGIFFQQDTIFVVSEPDGARYWFPCNDHPRDKATYHFELVVPDTLTGVANGKLTSVRQGIPGIFPDGKAADMYVWDMSYPMATYLATVAVGNYERVESTTTKGIQLRSYVFPEKKSAYESMLPTISEAMDWMSDTFGAYPFDEFGYVMVKGLDGASLETQTMVIIDQNIRSQNIYVHEMSHQWFGDWVSLNSWQDTWRNEGIATYIAALWPNRDNQQSFENKINPQLIPIPVSNYPIGTPPPSFMFGSDVYNKGALFLQAIRNKVGDEAFFQGLHAYLAQYGGSVASRDDFRKMMEQTGGTSLEDLFATWLDH